MNIAKFFTDPNDAVAEIQRRRNDTDLRQRVADFLNNDIPAHFNDDTPILYLARHVVTPSHETLKFIEKAQPHGLPIVLSQDTKDKFVSNNSMKRTLGKMPVVKGVSRNTDEIIEHFTIIDFDDAQGKPFREIMTKNNGDLVNFHTSLLRDIYPSGITIVDEAEWIDRNGRGNILEHYKKFLTLFLAHGILYETFIPEDYYFVKHVLEPAVAFVEEIFGYRPLICELIPSRDLNDRNWDAYPSVLYARIKNMLTGGGK